MNFIGEWLRRVWYLLNRRRLDAALRQEMEAHRAEMGQPSRFGNTLRLREESQDAWGWRWLDSLWRDVAFALRALRRSPAFTIVTTLILAIGVGVNLAFFQIVNATLLQPYPVKGPRTLAQFYRQSPHFSSNGLPLPMADFIAQHPTVLSAVLTARIADVAWGRDGTDRVRASFVSPNWFDELGASPAVGQLFHPDQSRTSDRASGVVLSYDLWQRDFASRPDIVGEVVWVNDRAATVMGVAARRFCDVDLRVPALWMPIGAVDTFFNPANRFSIDWTSGVQVYGRFAPGLSAAAVRDGLRATLADLSQLEPDRVKPDEWLEPFMATDRFMSAQERRSVLVIAMSASGLTLLVLLIACLNLSNLMLARAVSRVRELSIRSSLGASRWRAMRPFVFEGGLVATLGGVAGLVLGLATAQIVSATTSIPPTIDLAPDWRTVLACLGAIVISTAVVGLVPAWRVGRRDLALAVRDGGERASEGLQSARLRSLLVAIQLAGCAVLLVFAGQLLQGLERMRVTDLGFDFENVAVLDPSFNVYGVTPEAAAGYWAEIKARIATHPEVERAVLAWRAPLGSTTATTRFSRVPNLTVATLPVEPGFFSLMRVPIRYGRVFQPSDVPGTVVIISEKVATEMYGRQNVVGEGFPIGERQPVVVGVAGDAHMFTPHATNVGESYSLIAPSAAAEAVLLARARTDAARLPVEMRQASRAVAPQISPATRLMRTDFADKLEGPRVAGSIAAMTALLALGVACIGIAGVVSYVTSRRTKEIGIRLALGATSTSVVRALLGGSALTGAIGVALGLAGGWTVGSLFAGQPLYVQPNDTLPYVAATITLALSATVAALWPAIRLIRTDPLKALRVD